MQGKISAFLIIAALCALLVLSGCTQPADAKPAVAKDDVGDYVAPNEAKGGDSGNKTADVAPANKTEPKPDEKTIPDEPKKKDYTCAMELSPGTITAGRSADISYSLYSPQSREFEYNCGNETKKILVGGLSRGARLCQFDTPGDIVVSIKTDGEECISRTLHVLPAEQVNKIARSCSIASSKRDTAAYDYEINIKFAGFEPEETITWVCDYNKFSTPVGGSSGIGISTTRSLNCNFDQRPFNDYISVSIGDIKCGEISTR